MERFNKIIVSAAMHGPHADLYVIHTGGYQKRDVWIATANLLEKLHTTPAGHLEVGNNRIERRKLQSG